MACKCGVCAECDWARSHPDEDAALQAFPDTRPLADVLEQKTAEIEATGLCKWGYRDSGPASLNRILDEQESILGKSVLPKS